MSNSMLSPITDPITTIVKSWYFGTNNVDKAENGHIGRAAVATGQVTNLVKDVSTFDNKIGKGANSAVTAFKSVAQEDKIFDYLGKALNFTSKNINPLIGASALIDIAKADDKKSAIATNAAGLGAMFTVEHLMKQYLDGGIETVKNKVVEKGETNKTIGNICKKVAKADSKCSGKFGALTHALLFIIGSGTAYGLGDKLGGMLVGNSEGTQS